MGLCCVDSRKVQKGAIEVLFEIFGCCKGLYRVLLGFYDGSMWVLCSFKKGCIGVRPGFDEGSVGA